MGGAAGASLLIPGPFFHWKVPPAANPWPHSRPITQPRAGLVHLLHRGPGGLLDGAALIPTDPQPSPHAPPCSFLPGETEARERAVPDRHRIPFAHKKGGFLLPAGCFIWRGGSQKTGPGWGGGGRVTFLAASPKGGWVLAEGGGGGGRTAGLREVRGRVGMLQKAKRVGEVAGV